MTQEHEENLGICDITARTQDDQLPQFVTREEIETSLAGYPLPETSRDPFRHMMEVTPGFIKLSRSSALQSQVKPAGYKPRSDIKEWSPKSRSRMVFRLGSLDYQPLLGDPTRVPKMLTLTYPNDWFAVAPDGETAKRHLKMFRARYERKWAEPFRALWKMEFQRRGACHFHIFTSIPFRPGFAEWVSETWTDIVSPPDPNERAAHLIAGTQVDTSKGDRKSDAARVARYFAKHNAPNKGSKEYQNHPCEEWVTAGKVGRFWGYWNLKPLTAQVALDERNARQVARILRRWNRANAEPVRVQVMRVCTRTGVIRYRWVKRRQAGRLRNGRGFLEVAHPAPLTAQIAEALRQSV